MFDNSSTILDSKRKRGSKTSTKLPAPEIVLTDNEASDHSDSEEPLNPTYQQRTYKVEGVEWMRRDNIAYKRKKKRLYSMI